MPRVSVLTASYNHERYIERCLESVRDQTYRDVEHVVVDDGSTDGTPALLEGRSDIVYLRQENAGNVASRNRALELSSGAFVAVLDGDDYWDSRKLERQMDLMEADPRIGLVYTGMVQVDDAESRVSRVEFRDITGDPLSGQLVGNATPFSSMLIRREALEGGVLLDSRFSMVGDQHLSLRIALAGWRFGAVEATMLFLRTHDASMRYSPGYRIEYLRQSLGVLDDVAADVRLSPKHRGLLHKGYGHAYFATGWLMIDRGSPDERRAARPYLWAAVKQDPGVTAKVGKQLVKSFVRSLNE